MSERMSISRQSLVGRSGKTTFRSPTDAGKGGFLALAQPCRVNEGNLARRKKAKDGWEASFTFTCFSF